MKNLSRYFLLLVLILFALQGAASAAVLYIKTSGSDANSGLSWDLAKRTVQAAVTAANQGDEIWVAAGTYAEHIKNKTTGPQGSEVAVDVALYGGFAGTETALDQRNWQTNVTTLDGGGATGTTVNGSVLIIDAGATQATRIDGFVITGGHGIAAGGIYIGGSGPVIANNTITQNFSNVGGGILISNYKITPPQVHPVITNNTIAYNYAIEVGGGIVVVGSERLVTYDPVSPTITRNNISRNVSAFHAGGIGIFGHAAPQIANNYIFGNTAAYSEATFMGNGGGIYATSRDVDDAPLQFTVCAPVIVSNVIAANGANFGGGIHLWDTDVDHGGIPVLTNNTVFGNNGTGISWMTTKPIIQNNLVAYNSRGLEQGESQDAPQSLRNNCVYGNELWEANTDYNGLGDQTGINGNISADPKMANYKIGNFRLQTGSPLIDAGYSAAVGGGWTDFDGQARIIGSAVDIGADEADGAVGPAATPIYHVRTGGNDAPERLELGDGQEKRVGRDQCCTEYRRGNLGSRRNLHGKNHPSGFPLPVRRICRDRDQPDKSGSRCQPDHSGRRRRPTHGCEQPLRRLFHERRRRFNCPERGDLHRRRLSRPHRIRRARGRHLLPGYLAAHPEQHHSAQLPRQSL